MEKKQKKLVHFAGVIELAGKAAPKKKKKPDGKN